MIKSDQCYRSDLEVHMVHQSSDGINIAVVGILYEIGPEEDPFLREVCFYHTIKDVFLGL